MFCILVFWMMFWVMLVGISRFACFDAGLLTLLHIGLVAVACLCTSWFALAVIYCC